MSTTPAPTIFASSIPTENKPTVATMMPSAFPVIPTVFPTLGLETDSPSAFPSPVSYSLPCEELFEKYVCVNRSDCALEKLFSETDGCNWKSNNNWLKDPDMCSWWGVKCDDDEQVVSVELWNNNLVGTLPTEIGELQGITRLDLGMNSLVGTVPESLGQIATLEILLLNNNDFTGTVGTSHSVCQLSNLWAFWTDCTFGVEEVVCECCTACTNTRPPTISPAPSISSKPSWDPQTPSAHPSISPSMFPSSESNKQVVDPPSTVSSASADSAGPSAFYMSSIQLCVASSLSVALLFVAL